MYRRVLSLLLCVPAVCAISAASAAAAPMWASAASATIHPGVQVRTGGAQRTADFVFSDASNVYLGQAAHCSGTGSATDTDGCTLASLPVGTPVDITGASRPGALVYNSWLAMQALGESDPDTCAFNDLALVRVDPADVAKVNPSIPFRGGRTGVDGDGTRAGDKVLSFGNSELRGGVGARAEGGGEPRRRRRRLVAHGLHRDAGHPGRPRAARS